MRPVWCAFARKIWEECETLAANGLLENARVRTEKEGMAERRRKREKVVVGVREGYPVAIALHSDAGYKFSSAPQR